MATVNLTVEVPDDEVESLRKELVDLCFDFGLPVDDEDQFEEDTDVSTYCRDASGFPYRSDPGVEDLPPAHSPAELAELHAFLESFVIVIVPG